MKRIIKRIINKIDKIRYKNRFPNTYFDNKCYRNMTASLCGASIEESLKIINKYIDIKGKDILVIGCGKGKEIIEIKKHGPRFIYGFDYFNYKEDWNKIRDPCTILFQCDINNLKLDKKFDIILSKAVFEHIKDLDKVFPRIMNHLKEGGYMWADFGSLWYAIGGSHVKETYKHTAYNSKDFLYLNNIDKDNPGYIYWEYDMFSRMTYDEYINLFNKYMKKKYLAIEICQHAIDIESDEKDKLIKSIFYLGKKK